MQITFTFRFPLTISVTRKTRPSLDRRWCVTLDRMGDRKIAVIKAIRAVTQEGLREVKTIVDGVQYGSPSIAAHDLSPAQARNLVNTLHLVGASAHVEESK